MAKFACSGLAIRDGGATVAHGLAFVEAANKDEAVDKAMRIQHKLYPAADGWSNHHVVVGSVDIAACEPETAQKWASDA